MTKKNFHEMVTPSALFMNSFFLIFNVNFATKPKYDLYFLGKVNPSKTDEFSEKFQTKIRLNTINHHIQIVKIATINFYELHMRTTILK